MNEIKDMTLLDYFAGQALAAMQGGINIGMPAHMISARVYEIAQSMINERNKKH